MRLKLTSNPEYQHHHRGKTIQSHFYPTLSKPYLEVAMCCWIFWHSQQELSYIFVSWLPTDTISLRRVVCLWRFCISKKTSNPNASDFRTSGQSDSRPVTFQSLHVPKFPGPNPMARFDEGCVTTTVLTGCLPIVPCWGPRGQIRSKKCRAVAIGQVHVLGFATMKLLVTFDY